ncbi:hypothetical protein [Lentilitoribacter sp. EG35]|uniref:hypothetical protein n=1 Tax=Lentilitoribacter sp. EG35 TaxID=3234192 RepID=UPI0034613E72
MLVRIKCNFLAVLVAATFLPVNVFGQTSDNIANNSETQNELWTCQRQLEGEKLVNETSKNKVNFLIEQKNELEVKIQVCQNNAVTGDGEAFVTLPVIESIDKRVFDRSLEILSQIEATIEGLTKQ